MNINKINSCFFLQLNLFNELERTMNWNTKSYPSIDNFKKEKIIL